MKTVIAILLSLPMAWAAAGEQAEIIETTGSVSIHTLRCEMWAGSQMGDFKTRTSLGKSLRLSIIADERTQLNHTEATNLGCDIKKLDKVADEAAIHFGFAPASIKITRKTSDPFKQSGQCVAWVIEDLEITLGEDIHLSSTESEYIPRDEMDCVPTF